MFIVIILIAVLMLTANIPINDNDTFFHLAVGKEILNNGFLTRDVFSMHNLFYTPQQWLSDVVFYGVYKIGGFNALFIFEYAFMALLLYIFYKVNMIITEGKKPLAFLSSFFQLLLLNIFFIKIRPQIFTFAIFAILIGILELYIRKGNKKYLYFLPLLSLLLANFHIGTYPLFFVIMLPYIVHCSLKFRLGRIESGSDSKLKPLLVSFLISLPAGIINPYGYSKLLYFINLFSSKVTEGVTEWKSPDIHTGPGLYVFATMIVITLIFLLTNKPIKLKDLLLVLGVSYMTLSAIRYYEYLIIFGIFATAGYISVLLENNWNTVNELTLKVINRQFILVAGILTCLFIGLSRYNTTGWPATDFRNFPVKPAEYLMKNTDYKNIRIFNNYDSGGYLLFNGFKVFIDSRGDLYTPEYNPNSYVFEDYKDATFVRKHYDEIFDKYKIQYVLEYKEKPLSVLLLKDERYTLLYKDETYTLFKKK